MELGGCSRPWKPLPTASTKPCTPQHSLAVRAAEKSLPRKHTRSQTHQRNRESSTTNFPGQDWLCWTLPRGWQCPPCTQERSWVCQAGVCVTAKGSFCKKDFCETWISDSWCSWCFKPVKLNWGIKIGQPGTGTGGEFWSQQDFPTHPCSCCSENLLLPFAEPCLTAAKETLSLLQPSVTQHEHWDFFPLSFFLPEVFFSCGRVDENMLWLKPCFRLRKVSVVCRNTKA